MGRAVKLPRVNAAEESFAFQCRAHFQRGAFELGEFVRNHRFHPVRRWTLDFAWPAYLVALEIQGGIWIGGAHARPVNIERDMEKHNALLDLGWRCYQFTPKQVTQGVAVQHIERVLLCARKGGECVTGTGTTTTTASRLPSSSAAPSGA